MAELEPPRFIDGKPMLIAGIAKRYNRNEMVTAMTGIPLQWQRFLVDMAKMPGRVGRVAYGVSYNGDQAGNFDYLCGVEVTAAPPSPDFSSVSLGTQRYAVFTHRGPISAISATWRAIYQWLPASGYMRARAPDFERYSEDFDTRSNSGYVEIWIPVGPA
jgi:AraC family transcriptional regulator